MATALWARNEKDTAFLQLYKRYYQLYGEQGREKEFYEASEQMKDYYLKIGRKKTYYKMVVNEILFEAEHGKSYRAIRKANDMLEDIKEGDEKHYDMVYSALGTIYESRGNYRMADKYYMDALKNCNPSDTASLISIYSRLASLKCTREPEKAWEWNEKFGKLSGRFPDYHKIYLALKGEISFFLDDKAMFMNTYDSFQNYLKTHPNLDKFGIPTMEVIHTALMGNYQEALRILDQPSPDFNDIDKCDIRIKIFELTGNHEQALEEVNKRRDIRDSLNSDMMFNNLNEINADLGLAKLNEAQAKEREWWLAIVVVLLLIGIGLIASRYLQKRRYQKRLLKKNKELEIALSRAEESDRMKDSFIEHVSHEIRTPLNVITGYAQIITNPDYDLDAEERNQLLRDISKNTKDITEIVNELLEVAQDESKNHYQKDDIIEVNNLCRRVISIAEKQNAAQLQLTFDTEVDDSYCLKSNRHALEKVLNQLMNNALKFTQEGSINLRVHQSPDHGVVRFIISDTGIGIAEEHQERIFERFYKVDSFKQGFGLGLTMSRKIAILLGGSLYIDKNYTQGARFIMTLPA
jgi:signal transduction histidine kinase